MVAVVFVDGPAAGALMDVPVAAPSVTIAYQSPATRRAMSYAAPDEPIPHDKAKYVRVPWSFDDGPAYAYLLDDPDAWRGPPAPNIIPDYPPDER